jgi:YD repeat-containing protein
VKRINSTNVCVDETTLSSSCTVGNPCSPLTGDKIAIERDIASIDGLSFSRTYHSKNLALSDIGVGWKHNYMRRWVPALNGVGGYFETASGYQYPMVWSSSSKKYISVNKQGYSIEEFEDTWILTKPSKERDIYSQNGRLLRTETNDYVVELTYQQDRLAKVENSYGQNLLIKYNNQGQLKSITDAFGAIYSYQYDLIGNLSEVIYPDLTISDDSDNPRKVYHYENETFPNHLTGITDENGNRYATYSYDVNGKATSTEHAVTTNTVGQERFKLDYQGAN